MSGGIDSSVAAAILKRVGVDELRSSSRFANARVFDVVGVFMKLYDSPRFKEAEKRAREIAEILKIPFLSLDLRKEFKKRIINYFLNEYKKGITPNPCIVCNKEIKFGLLLEKALALDADYVATGHYVRTSLLKNLTIVKNVSRVRLFRGKDKERDQSYFLWMLNQNQLRRILFPIGDYARAEVKSLAKKFRMFFLTKIPKSMEICFIQTTINDFLKRYLKPKLGAIVTVDGKKIGEHQGLFFYTIGQRKGIELPGGPFYVLDKDLKKNFLIVTKNERDLYKKELIARNVNWIFGKEPKLPLKVKAKIRYRHEPASAAIYKIPNTKYKILFNKPQRAITPGQSVVFYRKQELLGGGIIC